MRFMVLVKADKNSEAGIFPDDEGKLLTEMGKYNEQLMKAGVLLAAEGLHPTSKGARVKFSGGKRTVIDGPFTEAKELVAGFWLIQVKSKEEAIEWVKRTLAEAGIPFEAPRGAERAARLSSVLEVLYLVFNEGYSATAGEDWMRPALCEDALRLGRILAELAPKEAEVHGLVALMEIQASRAGARIGPAGEPILLLDQNRARWDQLLIRRGLAALARAEELGGARGPYALQAAIAAGHARARTPAETDWTRIAALYDALAEVAPSPIVELNRAVAVAMAFGPQAGLKVVDGLTSEPLLKGYHLLPSVRGDLLARLGRFDESRAEFERAAALTRNARELLLARAARSAEGADP